MVLTLETSYIQDALGSKYPEGREEEKNRASPRSVLLTLGATNKITQCTPRSAFKHVAYARDPIIFHVPPPLSYIHPSHTSIFPSIFLSIPFVLQVGTQLK